MNVLKRLVFAVLAVVSAAVPIAAHAQAFPDHALKLVVPFPPGGATDTLGRILAKKMGELLNQPFVVENHGGAGGTIGTDYVSRQPADGYTMVLVNAIPHTASRKLYPIKYDPVKRLHADRRARHGALHPGRRQRRAREGLRAVRAGWSRRNPASTTTRPRAWAPRLIWRWSFTCAPRAWTWCTSRIRAAVPPSPTSWAAACRRSSRTCRWCRSSSPARCARSRSPARRARRTCPTSRRSPRSACPRSR